MTTRYLRKRRALSQIIVSLILVAIVASVGSTVLFRGLGEINTFSLGLNNYGDVRLDSLRENLLFENIHFNSTTGNVQIYVANTGTSPIIVSTVTIVKADTQELIVSWQDVSKTIQIDSSTLVDISNPLPGISKWSDSYYLNGNYKIAITTSKGNFFTTVAKPYDT